MDVYACQKCGAGLETHGASLGDRGGHGLVMCEVCHTLHSIATSAPSSDALASSSLGNGARIPMTDEAVLAVLRQHVASIDSMYLCPNIPCKKELAARAVHARHLPSDERVLALFDDTVFGSGEDGFVITSQRVCWKNVRGRAHMVVWEDVDPDRLYADRRRLVLGAGAIEVSADEAITFACEETFHVLAFSARALSQLPRQPVAGSGVVLAGASADDTGLHSQHVQHQSGLAQPSLLRPSERPTLRPSRPPALESVISPRGDLQEECWPIPTPRRHQR